MRRLSFIRFALLLAVAGVALAAFSSYLSLRRFRTELLARLDGYGTAERNPEAADDVRRETDRLRAALKTARVLLAEELDRRWLAELSPAAQEQALALGEVKLEAARDLALESVRDRPSSWQGLMILGGSRYLLASRRNTAGRWTERDSWERPLLAAIARAPQQPEPKRILSAAYLSEWSIASETERDAALAVIKEAFRDLGTLDQLLPAWLARAGSFEQALSVVPPDPRAWRQLDQHYRRREDWQKLAVVLGRLDRSLAADLDRRLNTARRMIAGGDSGAARNILLAALSEAPVRLEYAPFLEATLTLLPAGPVSTRQAGNLRAWIDWTFDRCIIAECPFAADVARRLARLAREPSASRQALASLIAGDLDDARAIEERSMAAPTQEWLPPLLLEAKLLALRGQRERALAVLADLPKSVRHRALVAHVARELGAGSAALGGSAIVDSGWLADGNRIRRERLDRGAVDRLEIRFDQVGAGGAALEVRINGALEGFHGIEAGSVLRLERPSTSNLVVLELRREAGAGVRPSDSI